MLKTRQTSLRIGSTTALAALSFCWTGCEGWPRYAHKPSTESDALAPDTPPNEGVNIKWQDATTEEETADGPGAAEELALFEGMVQTGELTGLGWDVDASVPRVSACDNALAFPPDAPGTYTGDVDWITIAPQTTGVLCLSLMTEGVPAGDEGGIDTRIDAVLYTLDECNEPVALYVEDGTSNPIGTDLPTGTIQWAIGVDADEAVAVGIAGFWPDDDTLIVPWTAHLSLVPGIAAAPNALCPEIDE